MIVRVPGSSANLGPGFDALGMAVSLEVEMGLVGEAPVPPEAVEPSPGSPLASGFDAAGGVGRVWIRSAIPMGRGLGFSGAVRVGGALLALAQSHGGDIAVADARRAEVLEITTRLEGHPDNVAASIYGGVVAAAAGRAIGVPLALDPAVVVWIPTFQTRTDESRRTLPEAVAFTDAVFNIGRTALLVAALAAGDVAALRSATQDRLHQQIRLRDAQPSAAAIEAAHAHGAWATWLSGSGPTIAALCDPAAADALAAALPSDGEARVLRIDHAGARYEAAG